jgi:hypothetical protein
VGRVAHSWAAFDVAATTASKWILVVTVYSWILATTASSRSSRPKFQHSSPTFRPGILAAAAVGTSNCRASPGMGNASMNDTDAALTFFAIDGKSFVHILSIVQFAIRANV